MSNENLVSRRAVLCGIAVLALGITPEKAVAANGISVLAGGKVEIDLAKNPALKKVGGVVEFQDGNGNPFALVRTSKAAKGYSAMSLSCTHQGVTVQKSGSEWVCPGHGAHYALNGKVTIGPAKRNLVALPVKVSATKVIVG